MTTVIGVETPTGVQLAWDSLGGGEYDMFECLQPKVFVNGGIIFGCAGNLGFANELRFAEMPKPPTSAGDMDYWMTRELVPALRALAAQTQSKNAGEDVGVNVLVVAHARAYMVVSDLTWSRRADGLYVIGSGGDYATGALAAGATALQALAIAAAYDKGTGMGLQQATEDELLDAVLVP